MTEPVTALSERPKSREGLAQLEQVVIRGDLSVLSEAERIGYYARVCDSLGINPLTRPFEYLTLNGKMVLYARKDAADQLRSINGISIDRLERERDDALGLAIVTAYGHDRRRRTDSAIGAVSIKGVSGDALANALMKAETKAKRRLTLSLAGLGWLDESEIGSIDEGPAVSVVVETRREAVQERLAAVPEAAAPAPEPQPNEKATYTGTAIEPDDIPFEQGARRQGDPWMRRIHAIAAERGLDHDGLHRLAVAKLGISSMTDMTPYQRADLELLLEGTQPLASVEASASGEAATAEGTAVAAGAGREPVDSQLSAAPTDAPALGPDAGPSSAPSSPPGEGAGSVPIEQAGSEVSLTGAAAPAPPDDAELRARYAWGAERGFGDDQLDEAAIAAVGSSPLDADQATWRAFVLTVESGAIPPPGPPPPKVGTQAYRDLPDGMARARARQWWREHDQAQAVGAG